MDEALNLFYQLLLGFVLGGSGRKEHHFMLQQIVACRIWHQTLVALEKTGLVAHHSVFIYREEGAPLIRLVNHLYLGAVRQGRQNRRSRARLFSFSNRMFRFLVHGYAASCFSASMASRKESCSFLIREGEHISVRLAGKTV